MSDAADVLIIDDEEAVRRATRRVLEHAGLHSLEAEDGHTGLELCGSHAPGVVFLDLRMPHMDGLDVLSALNERHPETPVVVMSGYGTMTDAVEALRRGAWDFVAKPMDNELLVRAARRGLERSSLLRQNREYAESLRRMNERLTVALDELQRDEQGARALQFQLLPEDGLRIGPLCCFRLLYPSQMLSGDFVDYFPLGSHYAGMYLADVAGHGAASAFVTAILTTLVAKYREGLRSRGDETILHPQQFLTSLDADLLSLSVPKHVTMFYAVLDLESRRLVYANAGAFPFPFLASGGKVIELECAGRPLNLPGRGRFGTGEAKLTPGARLLLVSDGVLELEPKQTHRVQRDRVATLLGRSTTVAEISAQLGLAANRSLRDDVALLFARLEEA
jgi:serine phosphatase RsbU (regulator of sigma subunit)